VSTEGEDGVGRTEPVNITPLQHIASPTIWKKRKRLDRKSIF